MAILPIRIYGDPVLRERAREIQQQEVDDAFRAFIDDMGETMYAAKGIGLAANQVGDLRRVFVADWDQAEGDSRQKRTKNPAKRHLRAFINPVILESSTEDLEYNEGCLSIPEVEADVWRPLKVRVRYRTLDWEEREEWLDELAARVFQHELDHIDGILFIDHLSMLDRARFAIPLKRLKKSREGASPA
jgi:peptide deformylase